VVVAGPAPLFRVRGRERAQILFRAARREPAIRAVREAVESTAAEMRGVSFSVDVDPQ
jgi:primosomal protein N' (replication factor Y)